MKYLSWPLWLAVVLAACRTPAAQRPDPLPLAGPEPAPLIQVVQVPGLEQSQTPPAPAPWPAPRRSYRLLAPPGVIYAPNVEQPMEAAPQPEAPPEQQGSTWLYPYRPGAPAPRPAPAPSGDCSYGEPCFGGGGGRAPDKTAPGPFRK